MGNLKLRTTIAALVILSAQGAARAATPCSVDSLTGLGVLRLTVLAATSVPAANGQPSHCLVEGSLVTSGGGAPDGRAGLLMRLPDIWQNRFLFLGVGGQAGNFNPSANAVDQRSALNKGYVTIVTDTGHKGDGTDASSALDDTGKPNRAARVDFFWRAAHAVTEAGKTLTEAYYAGRIKHAYFDGCSTGGRMALTEAQRFPRDFDGIIAGDPAMDYRSQIARIAVEQQLLSSPEAYLAPPALATIDKAVRAQCDASDGTADGLIQNPEACAFKAANLLCKPGQSANCLTAPQVGTLNAYLSPVRDASGRAIFPGMSPSDLPGPQGIQITTTGFSTPDYSKRDAPWSGDPNSTPRAWKYSLQVIKYWLGFGADAKLDAIQIDHRSNKVEAGALKRFASAFAGFDAADTAAMATFARQGRKAILYHGYSDPSIPPARTTAFYRELAARMGGYSVAQRSVRLFMVPGMNHCSGGPGPDSFDTLSALEAWVENGRAPDAMIATVGDPNAARRSMPLCPYPAIATHTGAGDATDAARWKCTRNTKLLQTSARFQR